MNAALFVGWWIGWAVCSVALCCQSLRPTLANSSMRQVRVALSWSWSGGAKSFALVLTDVTDNLVHWVIWDIPEGTTALCQVIWASTRHCRQAR